jgi:hypothetical protein
MSYRPDDEEARVLRLTILMAILFYVATCLADHYFR